MDPLIARLGIALAIGLLVGLERGWREREAPPGSRTAGIRTYSISGLLGGVFSALATAFGEVSILIAGFIGFAAVFAWFKLREAQHDEDFSVTAVIAGLGVFALGALAVAGDSYAAAAGGAALAALLASREMLHGLLRRLTWVEVRSALMLAAMTVIILPLLPNRTVDPWGGLNPWEIWLFTVLTAAISFLGYAAVRMLGPRRGLLLSSVLGAVVSSTAVTVAVARAARDEGSNPATLAGAASLAAAVSVLRVCAIVAVLDVQILVGIAYTAAAAIACFTGFGLLLVLRSPPSDELKPPTYSPFDLGPLLLFALVFAIVATANAALAQHVGQSGLVASIAASGAFDVDVAVLSALRLVGRAATVEVVTEAVLAAIAVNSLVRLVVAMAAGPLRFWAPLGMATVAAIGAGTLVFLIPA
jgi:uncharacterized membrane protein (DUF4010 family)